MNSHESDQFYMILFTFILLWLISTVISFIYLRIFSELLTREESVEEVERKIAALTTDSRSQWCLNRRRFFLDNALNRASLAVIESANFCMILDDTDYSEDSVGEFYGTHMHVPLHFPLHI